MTALEELRTPMPAYDVHLLVCRYNIKTVREDAKPYYVGVGFEVTLVIEALFAVARVVRRASQQSVHCER
jgi:hypothetical protein